MKKNKEKIKFDWRTFNIFLMVIAYILILAIDKNNIIIEQSQWLIMMSAIIGVFMGANLK